MEVPDDLSIGSFAIEDCITAIEDNISIDAVFAEPLLSYSYSQAAPHVIPMLPFPQPLRPMNPPGPLASPFKSLQDIVLSKKREREKSLNLHKSLQQSSTTTTRIEESLSVIAWQTALSRKQTHEEAPGRPEKQLKLLHRLPNLAPLRPVYSSSSTITAVPQREPKVCWAGKEIKKLETNVKNHLLHRACCQTGVSAKEIDLLLRTDPKAASRAVTLKPVKPVYDPITRSVRPKRITESYKYPLHLALKYGADVKVISMLIDAAPSVLSRLDGAAKESSLAVLLKYAPDDTTAILTKILEVYPDCVYVPDRHQNLPLHVACFSGASFDVVQQLVKFDASACTKTNFNGLTPLQIAQRLTNSCSNKVAYYLRAQEVAATYL